MPARARLPITVSSRTFVPILLAAVACWFAGCHKSAPVTRATTANDEVPAAPTVSAEKAKIAAAPREKLVPPAATVKKLDAQLLLALKQSRGEPPFDNPNTPQPDIPNRMGDRVLVDLNCAASDDLLKHLASLGGRVADTPKSPQLIRVMIPIDQLEAVASHADVKSIVPAELTVTSKATTQSGPESGNSKP